MSKIILRSQAQLLDDMQRRLRDPNNKQWSDEEIYMMLGDALMDWRGRVSIPHVYTVPGGWVTGQSDYVLPSYISGDITPQQRRHTDSYLYQFQVPSDQDQWVDVLNFNVWPNADGGLTLHWGRAPDAGDGRIIWWGRNGRLPLSLPTLSGDVSDSATSAVLTTTDDVPEAGYIKINGEWMGYAGAARGASTVTLSNLTRGVYGTTAAAHSTSDAVAFGVAVHRDDLFNQLYDATRSSLHALYLSSGAESERAHHERMTMYYRDQAQIYWRSYVPNKPTKLKFDRRTSGDYERQNIYQVTI